MATLTKKDLLEVIEDMPMDAEIKYIVCLGHDEDNPYNYDHQSVDDVVYAESLNEILLC